MALLAGEFYDFFPEEGRVEEHFTKPEVDWIRSMIFALQATGQLRVRFADRSRWNEEDNYALLKSGADVSAILHKFTDGLFYPDEYVQIAVDRLKKAFDAGLLVGGYHFFRDENGQDGADYFLERYRPIMEYTNGVYLPSMLDIELSWLDIGKAQRTNRAGNFLYWVSQEQDRPATWYTSPYLYGVLMEEPDWKDLYGLHLAHWTSAANPIIPAGLEGNLYAWQYGIGVRHSWVEHANGMVGEWDANRFMIDFEEVKKLAKASDSVDIPDDFEARLAALEQSNQEILGRLDGLDLSNKALVQALNVQATKIAGLQAGQLALSDRLGEVERIHEEIGKLLS